MEVRAFPPTGTEENHEAVRLQFAKLQHKDWSVWSVTGIKVEQRRIRVTFCFGGDVLYVKVLLEKPLEKCSPALGEVKELSTPEKMFQHSILRRKPGSSQPYLPL